MYFTHTDVISSRSPYVVDPHMSHAMMIVRDSKTSTQSTRDALQNTDVDSVISVHSIFFVG